MAFRRIGTTSRVHKCDSCGKRGLARTVVFSDGATTILDGGPPVSVRPKAPRPSKPVEIPPTPGPSLVAPLAPVVPLPVVEPKPAEHVHAPDCEHVKAAITSVDATVPGAIRAVLATENAGLLPRQIIEGVRVLRPETPEESVHGALHVMRKRGELAREGFHKNYRYRLTGEGSLTSLGAGVLSVANGNDAGGATH